MAIELCVNTHHFMFMTLSPIMVEFVMGLIDFIYEIPKTLPYKVQCFKKIKYVDTMLTVKENSLNNILEYINIFPHIKFTVKVKNNLSIFFTRYNDIYNI